MSTVLESQVYNKLQKLAQMDSNLRHHLKIRDQRFFISKIGEISVHDTFHAHKRKEERGITNFMIAIALQYGSKDEGFGVHKGVVRYTLYKKNLNKTIFEKYSRFLDGLVVFVKKNKPSVVITTYFIEFIPDNTRTKYEERKFRKIKNKAYKRLKNYLNGHMEEYY